MLTDTQILLVDFTEIQMTAAHAHMMKLYHKTLVSLLEI